MQNIIQKINNPFYIVAIALLIAAIFLFILYFLLKRRGNRVEVDETDLWIKEQQIQFDAAAEQIPYAGSLAEEASHLLNILREHLSLSLLAIYSGHERGSQFTAFYPEDSGPALATLSEIRSMMPEELSGSTMSAFQMPEVMTVDALVSKIGAAVPGKVASDPLLVAEAEQYRRTTGLLAVIPWRGPFDWWGLIIAHAATPIESRWLSRFKDGFFHIGSKLGVALQLDAQPLLPKTSDEQTEGIITFVRAVIRGLDDPTPLAVITRGVIDLIHSDSAAVWCLDARAGMVKMTESQGLHAAEFLPVPLGQGLAGRIAETGEDITLENAPSDPRCLFPNETRESGIVSYLGVPILLETTILGVLEVHSATPRVWNETEIDALKSAAQLAAEIIKNLESRTNRLRVESAYLGLSEALQRLRSREEVLEAAVEVLGHALGVSRGLVIEFDEKGKPLPVKYEFCAATIGSSIGIILPDQFAAKVLAETTGGRPIVIHNSKERSLATGDLSQELMICSELTLPIRQKGQTIACIYLNQCDRIREWEREEIEFADRVGRQVSLSLATVQVLEAVAVEAQAAQEEARRAAEMSSRARGFIDALPEAVIWLDPEGRLTFFNAFARDLFGLKNEDVGRLAEMTESLSMSEEGIWERVNAADDVERFQAALLSPSSKPPEGDGATPLPVSIAVAPVHHEQGEIAGRIVVLSDITHIQGIPAVLTSTQPSETGSKITELDAKVREAQTRADSLQSALAEAQTAAEAARANEDAIRKELEQVREDEARARRSAQQLVEINRLKSDFIVNAGRELQSSLQSLDNLANQLESGSFGEMTPEQHTAVHSVSAWAARIKDSLEWLMEYGSTRSRQADSSGHGEPEKSEEEPILETGI